MRIQKYYVIAIILWVTILGISYSQDIDIVNSEQFLMKDGIILPPMKSVSVEDQSESGKMLKEICDLVEKMKLGEAEEMLKEFLQTDPNNPAALNNMAAIMVNKKQYGHALDYLEKALSLAKGGIVRANQVCDITGKLKEFLPSDLGNWEIALTPVILNNINSVKAANK